MNKKAVNLSLIIVTCFLLVGCQSKINKTSELKGYSFKTLTLEGNVSEQYLDKIPEKVLVVGEKNAERMIYFGLENSIAGLSYLESNDNEALSNFPIIAKEWPSKESVIQLKPDLIYGISTVFQEDRLGDFSFWNKQGIATATTSNYSNGVSPDSFFMEIEEFGTIFHIEKETERFITEQKETIETIKKEASGKLGNQSVLFIASDGRGNYYYYPENYQLVDDIMTDLNANYMDLGKNLITLSHESLLKLNPDKIIFTRFMASDKQKNKDPWLSHQAISNVKAIQNNDVLELPYDNVIRGNEKIAQAYQEIVDFLKVSADE